MDDPDASVDAGSDAAVAAAAAVDLSGTWISQVKALATESGPIVGDVEANLQLVFRILFSSAGGMLNANYQICDLSSVTTPDPATLVVTFTPEVVATLTSQITESVGPLHVGDSVPFPTLAILSGVDEAGMTVDSDLDSHPGVTVPASLGGLFSVHGYVALTISASLTSKLTDADTLDGTIAVSANGVIVGSDNPLLASGTISVVPKTSEIPFTAKRLAGDVPCSEVLTHFP